MNNIEEICQDESKEAEIARREVEKKHHHAKEKIDYESTFICKSEFPAIGERVRSLEDNKENIKKACKVIDIRNKIAKIIVREIKKQFHHANKGE